MGGSDLTAAAAACSNWIQILHGITFRYVENMEEVLAVALFPEEAGGGEEAPSAAPPPETPGREIAVTASGRRRGSPSPRA